MTSESPQERYSRQTAFRPIGEQGQQRLRQARVLIVGCGALGTHTAEYLARAGVGEIDLVDRDVVDWSNLQRQIAYTEDDARQALPKAPTLASHLGRLNSEIRVVPHAVEFHFANALRLAQGKNLLLDATDNLPTRFLLNDVSYRLGTPWIYAGAVESSGHALAISGRQGPCLACLLGEPPPPGTLPTCDTRGVLGPAVAAIAGWQAVLALRILVEGTATAVQGRHIRLSPWVLEARVAEVASDPDCPVCVHGRYEYLSGACSEEATVLCGRQAVQVRPAARGSGAVDLTALATRLSVLGQVTRSPEFVRCTTDCFTATVFADGRAIFDGLTDRDKARSLYARFIGE